MKVDGIIVFLGNIDEWVSWIERDNRENRESEKMRPNSHKICEMNKLDYISRYSFVVGVVRWVWFQFLFCVCVSVLVKWFDWAFNWDFSIDKWYLTIGNAHVANKSSLTVWVKCKTYSKYNRIYWVHWAVAIVFPWHSSVSEQLMHMKVNFSKYLLSTWHSYHFATRIPIVLVHSKFFLCC